MGILGPKMGCGASKDPFERPEKLQPAIMSAVVPDEAEPEAVAAAAAAAEPTPAEAAGGEDAEEEEEEEEDEGGGGRVGPYTIGRRLGAGAYAEVFLGTVADEEEQYAVKVYKKGKMRKKRMGWGKPTMLQLVSGEIAIMKKIDHPNIVKLHDVRRRPPSCRTPCLLLSQRQRGSQVIDDEAGDQLLVVMELMSNGTTSIADANLPYHDELTCHRFMLGSVLGLEELHAQGVLHRDLKVKPARRRRRRATRPRPSTAQPFAN